MRQDELAFTNQQLAGMLKAGVPLEGALKQTCAAMARGQLREQLLALESDLSKGIPLPAAVEPRNLPRFYKAMLRVGHGSQDLVGTLTLVAEHYTRAHELSTRLRTALVYPLIVLGASFLVSILLAVVFVPFHLSVGGLSAPGSSPARHAGAGALIVLIWIMPLLIGALLAACLALIYWPPFRDRALWRVPLFRDAALARVGSMFSLMLSRGCHFRDALALLRSLEAGGPLEHEFEHWRMLLESGVSRMSQLTSDSTLFPPLFAWLVDGEGEDWARGFAKASETYHNRAVQGSEVALHAVMPVAMLAVGGLVLIQILPTYFALSATLSELTDGPSL